MIIIFTTSEYNHFGNMRSSGFSHLFLEDSLVFSINFIWCHGPLYCPDVVPIPLSPPAILTIIFPHQLVINHTNQILSNNLEVWFTMEATAYLLLQSTSLSYQTYKEVRKCVVGKLHLDHWPNCPSNLDCVRNFSHGKARTTMQVTLPHCFFLAMKEQSKQSVAVCSEARQRSGPCVLIYSRTNKTMSYSSSGGQVSQVPIYILCRKQLNISVTPITQVKCQ